MEVATRRVHFAGLSTNPDEDWKLQIARNVTDAGQGFLFGKKYLLMDRDSKYSEAFRITLEEGGAEPVNSDSSGLRSRSGSNIRAPLFAAIPLAGTAKEGVLLQPCVVVTGIFADHDGHDAYSRSGFNYFDGVPYTSTST